MKTRNQIIKERYHYYRSLGYSSVEANKMKHRSLDTEGFILGFRTVKGKKTKHVYITKNSAYYDARLDTYRVEKRKVKNDTVYSNWGYLTQVEPHASESMRLANHIAKRDGKSLKYGYYYLYLMTTQNLTNEQVAEIAKTDPMFEMYNIEQHSYKKPLRKKKKQKSYHKSYKNVDPDEALKILEEYEKKGW